MGRPSKISGPAARRIIEATARGATREAAAAAGPISRSTLYAWIRTGRLDRESPEGAFVAKLDAADDAAELAVIDAWREHFPKDWRACAAFLERRFPARWSRSADPAGADGGMAPITDNERANAIMRDLERWRIERGLEDPSPPENDEPSMPNPNRDD